MQMESSRRSILDRARDPPAKKPRLIGDSDQDRVSNGILMPDRDRAFSRDPRLRAGNQLPDQRIRPGERVRDEKEATTRPVPSQQEIVAEYKAALAELIFNSKPIITNLTIIAGENQHAAKEIASVICANILEVPSDQKLPSLYLLDSIVKNIGKDYIKHFAARLPEVFCKAYKLVDSSTHPGMRHLFGTWKGVFPSGSLQIIEKELCFPPIINGSSGATTSKLESQATQRTSHSIHVNPKYLEARQRLQQSSKAKDTSSGDTSGVVTTGYDADRYERTTIGTSTRQWTEHPLKMHNVQRPQREQFNDPIQKGYRDEFSPEPPDHSSDIKAGSVDEKIERDGLEKTYYRATGSASERGRNDFNVDHAYGTYRPSGSSLQSWKNSEEEEYMWDEIEPRLTDYGAANSPVKDGWKNDGADKPASLKRGKWMPEHLDSQWNKFDTTRFKKTPGGEERLSFRDIEEHASQPRVKQEPDSRITVESTADPFSLGRAVSGHRASSVWPPREPPPSMVGLNHQGSRISGHSEGQLIPHISDFPTSSSLPKPGSLSHTNPSSGGLLSRPVGKFGPQRHKPLQPPSPPPQSPPSSVSVQQPRPQSTIVGHGHLRSNSFSKMSQKSMTHLTQMRHNDPLTQPLQPDSAPIQTEKPPLGTHHIKGISETDHSSISSDVSVQSSTSSLLAAIMNSGLLSKNLASSYQSPSVHPPLPSGPPPSLPPPNRQGKIPVPMPAVLPPLPPGPPPASSLVATTPEPPDTVGTSLNPFSGLLSTLLAKGIISSPAIEPPALTPAQMPNEDLNRSSEFTSSALDEPSISESSPSDTKIEVDSLIGYDFKPEIIRKFHPVVIDTLFDELMPQCNECGLRLRLDEQLKNHLNWHDSKKSGTSSFEGGSRKWFADLSNWVAGKVEPPCGTMTTVAPGAGECEEPMVPADESQSLCALCGEPFEDLYSDARDEWMYKGTFYLDSTHRPGDIRIKDEITGPGPIVHAQCLSSLFDARDVTEQNKGWTDS